MEEPSANQFPGDYHVSSGRTYPCAKINYTFSITNGDSELLGVFLRINHKVTCRHKS